MFSKAQLKVSEAKKELDRQGLTMKVQSLRKSHDTQFYLYNVQNYLLCGDVSIDRANNKPEEDFIQEENQVINVNGSDVTCSQIGHIASIT